MASPDRDSNSQESGVALSIICRHTRPQRYVYSGPHGLYVLLLGASRYASGDIECLCIREEAVFSETSSQVLATGMRVTRQKARRKAAITLRFGSHRR